MIEVDRFGWVVDVWVCDRLQRRVGSSKDRKSSSVSENVTDV